MLTVVTYLWESKVRTYSAAHVNRLFEMVSRNLTTPHRFVCVTDQPDGIKCQTIPIWPAIGDRGDRLNCYRRLFAFSNEHPLGDRIFNLDLDIVITKNIDHIVNRDEDFIIWKDPKIRHNSDKIPYNGGQWLLRSGSRT